MELAMQPSPGMSMDGHSMALRCPYSIVSQSNSGRDKPSSQILCRWWFPPMYLEPQISVQNRKLMGRDLSHSSEVKKKVKWQWQEKYPSLVPESKSKVPASSPMASVFSHGSSGTLSGLLLPVWHTANQVGMSFGSSCLRI